jgi:oligoribonuclease NrnB/cAMP/cGMP phosphodiesterase (DHH superfamily)
MRFTYSSTLKKRTKEAPNIVKRKLLEEFDQYYSHHRKIWRKEDYDSLKELLRKNDGLFGPQEKEKQKSYHFKTDEVRKRYKEITAIEDLEKLEQEDEEKHSFYTKLPLVHNHLQNNFFLGNKKALFYNLREYYEKIGEDIFNYVPLTFHIK